MVTLRLVPLLLALCLLLAAPAARAQGEDVLSREGDESATTPDERRQSLALLLAAARQARTAGEPSRAARFFNRAGRLQMQLGSPRDALATYGDAVAALGETPDPRTHVDGLNGLGMAYDYLSRCGEAQAPLRQAIALSEQHGYVAGKAEALLTLSDCQSFGDHAAALHTAREALALWQSLGLKRGVAQSYAAIGYYHLAQNELAEATRSQEAALDLWRELGVTEDQAEALINLGFIEYRKGAWQNVLRFLAEAQSLLDEEAEPYKMGQINAGLAEAFIESGLPETGLDKFRLALEYYGRAQNPRSEAVMVWGIGKTHYILGDYPQALSNLQRALDAAAALGEVNVLARCNDFLGRTFAATGDPAAALRHFELAFGLYTRASNPVEAAGVLALMGRVYEQQGKVERARRHYRKALATFRALSDRLNESATLYALGVLELKQRDLDAAEQYLRQSVEVTENVRRVPTSSDLTAAFSATVHERYERYVECLMLQHAARPGRGLDARAFETSELARARSLAELLRDTQTSLLPGLDPGLAEREKSLRQTLRVKEDHKVALLGRAYGKGELAALEAELAALEAEYAQVAEAIRASRPASERLTRPAAWGLRQIQEQVVADDETVLLEYSLGEGRSYAWAVTRRGFAGYELPARARIDEAAQKVYKLLAVRPDDDGPDELAAATRELAGMILAPVAAELGKRRVIVVADGVLNYIPFQILPSPSGEPLVADYEVVNAPSASILGELRQEAARRPPAPKVLAAFGNPVFASNYALLKGGGADLAALHVPEAALRRDLRDIELQGDAFDPSVVRPLFYARRELAGLQELAAGGETLVAEDFAATRERLLGTDLTRYSILHFATHGLLDPTRPEKSGLLLSMVDADGRPLDGFVGLTNIYGLRAPVDLVVLSACRTALGKDVRGEGLLGLTRGFMYAGASGVVSSLWKVDDEATAELMRHFYSNMLREGMDPAAALRAAQNAVRQRPDWRSPYFWAAFTLQGEHRRVVKPRPAAWAAASPGRVLAGGGLLTLSVGGAWWFRRRRRAARHSTVKK